MAVTLQCAGREKRKDFEINRSMADAYNNPHIDEGFDDELGHAEELITGDSDDPPLSETDVVGMLRISRLYGSSSL